ncbi:MAG: hypothetical protein ACM336_02040 [Acidobacteriota bacterium]
MAIDYRFSKQQFELAAETNSGSRTLSDQLETEVLQVLHAAVTDSLGRVVEQLNQMGHRLRTYYPPEPGDIAFRDDHGSNGSYVCNLRLGVDVVVSAGFRDTIRGATESEST